MTDRTIRRITFMTFGKYLHVMRYTKNADTGATAYNMFLELVKIARNEQIITDNTQYLLTVLVNYYYKELYRTYL